MSLSVIFFFILCGPFGALFYRLANEYYAMCVREENEEHADCCRQLLHWLDWAPARLSSVLFLLTGDFVRGYYRLKDFFADVESSNKHIISETGISALGLEMGVNQEDIKENKDALDMVNRTLIIYIVLVAALTPLTFW